MTGAYFTRLVARGRGGDAGPEVRALPRLYAPGKQGEDLPAHDAQVPASAQVGGRPRHAPELASATRAASRTASEAAPPSHVEQAHGNDVSQPANAALPPAPTERQADTAPAPIAPLDVATATASPRPVDHADQPDARAPADRPPHLSIRTTALAAPLRAGPAPLRHARDAPPSPGASVSIGRIDIVVAPPAPPAAPPPDPRTRGFSGYARLRRGLTR